MEYIHCDTCGSTTARPLHHHTKSLSLKKPYQIVQCTNCGFRYMNPRMTEQEYDQFYAGTEYLERYGYDELLAHSRIPEFKRTLRLIDREKPLRGKLLDIGCATGEFLVAAKEDGWDVYGTEISDSSVRIAHEKYGLDIFHGALEKAPFAKHSFNVIHLSHVLEHVPSPKKTLAVIETLLAPNGILVIEVPNELDNWFLRLGKILHRYRSPAQPSMHHVSFFSRRSLLRTLRTSGYIASSSTYSPQLPILHPPKLLRPFISLITKVVDGYGGGIHIQAIARRRT